MTLSTATACTTIWKARRLVEQDVDRGRSDFYLFMRETSNERGLVPLGYLKLMYMCATFGPAADDV